MAIQNDLTAEFRSDLEGFDSAFDGCAYILLGNTVIQDQPLRMYVYNSTSTATVDNVNVLINNALGGRYLRLNWEATASVPTIANTTRALNSNFTVSASKPATVTYSVTLSVTNPLLAGSSTASVFLEYSLDSGTTWTGVSRAINTSSVALAVAVAITNVQTSVVSGVVPINALCRLRSTTSGTAVVTYVSSQEVTY